jgi:hypothetical protein
MPDTHEISQEAARAMLAALMHVERWHDQLNASDLKQVRAAIAAADGR